MSYFSSSQHVPLSPTLLYTDDGVVLVSSAPISPDLPSSPGSSPSPSSLLDPFGFFSSPPPFTQPPSSPAQSISPSHPSFPFVEPSQRSSPSPATALLVLGGLTGGVALLASTSTFLLLRRSLVASFVRGENRTLQEFSASLSSIDGRLGRLEGRASIAASGGAEGEVEDEGGRLLSELRKEIGALRSGMERGSSEQEGKALLRDSAAGGERNGVSDLRAQSPYNFKPSIPALESPFAVASPPFPSNVGATKPPAALIKTKKLEQEVLHQKARELKQAMERKQAKLDTQSAKNWQSAFRKKTEIVQPSTKAWKEKFRAIKEEPQAVDAPKSVGEASAVVEAAEVVETPSKLSKGSPCASSQVVEVTQEDQNASKQEPASPSANPVFDSPPPPQSTLTSASSSSQPSSELPETIPLPPPTEPTPPLPSFFSKSFCVTTLAKDLDSAAELASKIDQHWYGSTSASSETSNVKAAEPRVKTKDQARAPPEASSSAPLSEPATGSSSSAPRSTAKDCFRFGSRAGTLFHLPLPFIGLGSVWSSSSSACNLPRSTIFPTEPLKVVEDETGSKAGRRATRKGTSRGGEKQTHFGFDRDGVLREFRRRYR